MSYNPTMEATLIIWKGDDAPASTTKRTDSPIKTVSTGAPYVYESHTTCRETLSRGIRSAMLQLGNNLPKGLLDAIGLHMSLSIYVQKQIKEEDALAVLNSVANNLPGYPVLSRFERSGHGYLTLHASDSFLYSGCPEAPLSFVMFFLNRIEHFPAEVMASYKATDAALEKGTGNFLGSSYGVGYRFALWAANRGMRLRWDIASGATSGVGEYMMYHVMPTMLADTVHFMRELNISLDSFKSFSYFASLKEAFNAQW